MATIRRLSDSCVLVTTDAHSTLIDPGFHPFESGVVELEELPEIDRVLITHEHRDHVHPGFVRWLVERRRDLTVHSNPALAELLAPEGIEVSTADPPGVTSEDNLHEPIPTGDQPPNRSYTLEGLFTHPGDSQQATMVAEVMALPLLAPWTSVTAAVAFARRVRPRVVIPTHDFYLSENGRGFVAAMASRALQPDGIEVAALGWGEQLTV